MKDRVFVITDERCGGTQFANLFTIMGYKTVDDPQTLRVGLDPQIHNKEFVLDNIEYFFKTYDYIKICMVSFTINEYAQILEKVVKLGCKIIFLWRKNFLERALSKGIAMETGVWHKKDYKKYNNGYFRLDVRYIREVMEDNKNKVKWVMEYLKNNKIKHYPILYENIYSKQLNGPQRLERFINLLNYIDPQLVKNMSKGDKEQLTTHLAPYKKVNSEYTYMKIINIKEIVNELASNINGHLDCNV